MGNANNLYLDPQFKTSYDQMQKKFKQQTPLFDVEDISFPLSTKEMAIVDKNGKRVKLAGGNWSGGHLSRHCVGGLDCQPLRFLCDDIKKKFGMNCVRLTFSLQLFKQNNVVDRKLIKANPQLFAKTAVQIFKTTVKTLTEEGLMVILNNHTSKSQWCCSDKDGDGLWFNKQYPEQNFFKCLEQLADIFKDNERVIGMDLRNQVRKSYQGTPTWGDGSKFDWKKAAETAGNRIHAKAPHWLIIVGGLNYQLDFKNVLHHPVTLKQSNKLVYSGHFYNFSWSLSFLIWHYYDEESFREKLFNDQLFVRYMKQKGTPFILGEFGNNTRDQYWIYLIKYLKQLDLDWIYWCLDGYKCNNQEDETYGLWDFHFAKVRNPKLLEDLKEIGRRKPQWQSKIH